MTWQEFVQSYNAQASVDIEPGFILSASVTQDSATTARSTGTYPEALDASPADGSQQDKESKQLYKLRSQTIEPTFRHIKEGRGIRRFILRSRPKVEGEWQLVTLGHNVLKLWRPQTG